MFRVRRRSTKTRYARSAELIVACVSMLDLSDELIDSNIGRTREEP